MVSVRLPSELWQAHYIKQTWSHRLEETTRNFSNGLRSYVRFGGEAHVIHCTVASLPLPYWGTSSAFPLEPPLLLSNPLLSLSPLPYVRTKPRVHAIHPGMLHFGWSTCPCSQQSRKNTKEHGNLRRIVAINRKKKPVKRDLVEKPVFPEVQPGFSGLVEVEGDQGVHTDGSIVRHEHFLEAEILAFSHSPCDYGHNQFMFCSP